MRARQKRVNLGTSGLPQTGLREFDVGDRQCGRRYGCGPEGSPGGTWLLCAKVCYLSVGYLYTTGQGVPRDYREAAEWFRKAAEQGFAPSQCNPGILYMNGSGVPLSYVEAYKWFSLAAGQGDRRSKDTLKALRTIMTASQLNDARLAISAWQAQHKSSEDGLHLNGAF